MKHPRRIARFVLGALCLVQALTTTATTFSTDTYIGPTDFSSDGDDIVVTNCTLTVDGAHGFNSLQLQNGGVLTHSAFTSGPGQIPFYVTNELQAMSATNVATLLNTNVDTNTIVVMDTSSTITYTPNVDYLVFNLYSYPYTILQLTTNSAIPEGANVLVSYTWDQTYQGLSLTISNDMQVLAGGAVNIQGKGYAGGSGPEAGTSQSTNYPYTFTAGGGGGHGGCGGLSSTFALGGGSFTDSTTNPAVLGSGGGTGSTNGGAGGGLAQLFVGGTLELDGQILADGLAGTNRHSGGGAGGGLLISAGTLNGAGSITANGGTADLPDGGGGGGGCIAVYFGTNNFTGSISAFGGPGAMYGGAGTIFTQFFSDPAGQLLIANAGVAGTNTTFRLEAAISNLTITAGAILHPDFHGVTVTNLFLSSNGSVTVLGAPASFLFAINGDAIVDSSSTINADFQSDFGPGTGYLQCAAGTGGGYGGYGGAGAACGGSGGVVYGSITQPSSFGSPSLETGKDSFGGGVVQMTVAGTLSLSGKILADGASAVGGSTTGGGSGGSIWLTVGTLAGSGLVSANGGGADAFVGGGGGGGRIAVYFNTNQFTGNMVAHGGLGANAGGPGTIYVLTNGSTFGQLTIDNAGLIGSTAFSSTPPLSDLTLSGASTVTNLLGSTPTFRNLFISSNSSISTSTSSLRIIATNIAIQAGGRITADGVSTTGPGGATVNGTGGGGANAGNGGSSAAGAAGGTAYGAIFSANTSGGVGGQGNAGLGGGGGGVISLAVAKLQLDGIISANGLAGPALNSGGGAGGSILLSVGILSGAGTLSVNGGPGNGTAGGGGGGGYLNVSYGTNQFSGSITTQGGVGSNPGGAGFTYLNNLFRSYLPQSVTCDDGGLHAGVTPLSLIDLPTSLSLNITGGAVVSNTLVGLNVGNLFVASNSTFLVGAFTSGQQTYSIGTNATIQPGGSLSVDGINNVSGSAGQGALYGGGGSYGGSGGFGSTNFGSGGSPIFDILYAPSFEGGHGAANSTGGAGANGGGSLRLTVNGRLQLDGRLSAQGAAATNLNAGGGAGGSIYLTAGTLAGAGVLSVNGGAGGIPGGGGGGGGRIALSCTSNLFTGNFTAYGGPGTNSGGAGTVYVSSGLAGVPPFTQLTIDNGGTAGNTFLQNFPSGNFNFTVTGGDTTALTNGSGPVFQNFLLGSNSTFICYPFSQQLVTVLTNATIQAGARFTADGASTSPGGQPFNQTGGGGGHAGYGGASLSNAPGGNVISDSVTQPTSFGNRGGAGFQNLAGGNGGGAFELVVNGTLQVDGKISADGLGSTGLNSGGGSGGSVWLSVGTLSGAGTISANGGAGNNNVGGGGGGGRVAVSYKTNLYSGAYSAHGGAGGHYGGAGTICLPVLGPPVVPPGQVQVIVDNGGNRGTNTLLSGLPSTASVTLNSGASATVSGSAMLNNLTISSNAAVTAIPGSAAGFSIYTAGNLLIQPGGAITLDADGSPANIGTGRGFSASPGSGGGGGHGGYGSSGINGMGGENYDSILTPGHAGSGGGSSAFTSGSAGGGALYLSVNGTLQVDGAITANGAAAITAGAGGGSGGSLWINATTLSGAGKITADGGNGDVSASGGGGGGGMIAAYFNSNAFTGAFSAHGGSGYALAGGAGTIFLRSNSATVGELFVDNGGLAGTNTQLATIGSLVNLTLQNGARGISYLPVSFQSLSINSGAAFDAPHNTSNMLLTVLGDAFVDSNAVINANALGDSGDFGIGTGGVDFFGNGGGGGYGGAGGASLYGAAGGITYGSSNEPIDFGSPGGTSPPNYVSSQGGGAIRLLVDGTLTLNGTVSANGNNGGYEGNGGGSGGSIWIATSTLSGTGNITANGGTGLDEQGGGGGGGRIAIYASANSFAGSASANGGNGFSTGQPGTILIATNLFISGSVTDTNGTGIAGVILQPNGMASVTTDNSGAYSVATPLFWTGSITPRLPATIFRANETIPALPATHRTRISSPLCPRISTSPAANSTELITPASLGMESTASLTNRSFPVTF